VQALVTETEVMADLMDHGAAYLVGADGAPVDRDVVG
jgi:hypothetical protein